MKLNIEFTIGFADPSKDYPWIIQRKLHSIKNKLKKYELKKMIGIDPIYKIDETNPIFLEAKQLMYEYLVENGISSKYFKECYTKRKNIIAYRLYSDNGLDVNAFYDDSYSYSFICSNYGKLYKNLKEDETYINKYIDENLLDDLEDVNITSEYFSKNKKIIVSKKVYNLVKEKDPDAMFLPIYIKHK